MRKLILISAMVLASATAQAGERSLTLGRGENSPAATPAPAPAANPSSKYVEAPPKPPETTPVVETPKYTARPAAVTEPAPAQKQQLQQATVEPTTTPAAKPAPYRTASSRQPARRQHARYWTHSRIIGELHRHGIYW